MPALTGRLIDAATCGARATRATAACGVLGVTDTGAEFLRAHMEPVLEVAEAALAGLPDALLM